MSGLADFRLQEYSVLDLRSFVACGPLLRRLAASALRRRIGRRYRRRRMDCRTDSRLWAHSALGILWAFQSAHWAVLCLRRLFRSWELVGGWSLQWRQRCSGGVQLYWEGRFFSLLDAAVWRPVLLRRGDFVCVVCVRAFSCPIVRPVSVLR